MKRSPVTVALAVAVALGAAVAGLVPGASGGYTARITNSTNTAASAPYFTCAGAATADRATAVLQYPLTDAAGSLTVTDASGNSNTGTYRGSVTTAAAPGACARDGGTAYVLDGTSSYITTTTQYTNPSVFTLEAWFKTSVPSGKVIQFGGSQNGTAGSYDRQLYLTTAGALTFGCYNGGYKVVASPGNVADGTWHHVIATLAPAGNANPGMRLYLDGALVASNATYTAAESISGYWRVGYGATGAWPNVGTNGYFTGAMRHIGIYSVAFTPAQVAAHYGAGR